ncbi:MAG: cation:proton antiporter subunit C [Candidatus Bipolaricaulia bacterium]
MVGLNGVTISIVLFGIGLLGMVFRRDLVVKLLALGLINSATILCLVSLGTRQDGAPPLLGGPAVAAIVDPLPQAIVLSAIVINFAILALALVYVMLLVERYHTTDSHRIERETAAEEETWS